MKNTQDPWPEFSFDEFKETGHLLHMLVQSIGKLKLLTPFEPEWSNVVLWITSHGLASGLIPYDSGGFSVDLDLINHQVICKSVKGEIKHFPITPASVAELTTKLFDTLQEMNIKLTVNPKPQEVPNPVNFDEDTQVCEYRKKVASDWWRILVNSYRVMLRYHGRFTGKTPPIGLMWGTLDIRDVRFNGKKVMPTGINSGYLRRNAMDEEQIECGWWAGNDSYPRPAYYSFTYPQPAGIQNSSVASGKWNNTLGLFLLDYDDVRSARNPDHTLLEFLESTYATGSNLAGWDEKLLSDGKPH